MDQKDNIVELLFAPYWRPEAREIIDAALKVGYSLDIIAYALTRFGAEALIVSTYEMASTTMWDMAVTGPETAPGMFPIITFAPMWFGPSRPS